MTLGKLRRWMVGTLLALTAGTVLFFLIAPALGYPLEFEQGWAIAQISIPVLTGYLGTATQFAVSTRTDEADACPPLLPLLVFGPISLYIVGTAILLTIFGLTNDADAPLGTGMSTAALSTILTVLLGIVTVTANIAVARIFKGQ